MNLNSTKLTSSTPPPMSSVPTPSNSLPHHSTSSHAHRKLFPPSASSGASPSTHSMPHHQHHSMHAHHHQVHHSAPHHMPPPPVPSGQASVPSVNTGSVMTPIEHMGDPSVPLGADDGGMNRVAPPDLSSIVHLKRSDSYFMGDELRSEIMRKNLMTIAPAPNHDVAMSIFGVEIFEFWRLFVFFVCLL